MPMWTRSPTPRLCSTKRCGRPRRWAQAAVCPLAAAQVRVHDMCLSAYGTVVRCKVLGCALCPASHMQR
jgi:hypothetical protein